MSIYHKHHIIPKYMGGTDDPSNLVEVTVEQHALLHKQLWKECCDESIVCASKWNELHNKLDFACRT